MIDATIHYRSIGSERRRLPAVPAVGSYVYNHAPAGRVWQVSAVVFDGNGVGVFAVEVSARLAGELAAAWATWANPIDNQGAESR